MSSLGLKLVADRVDTLLEHIVVSLPIDTVSTAFTSFVDPLVFIGSNNFANDLGEMREELQTALGRDQTVLGGTVTLTAGISVGYVVWLARSGMLISAALPTWRFINPLPI